MRHLMLSLSALLVVAPAFAHDSPESKPPGKETAEMPVVEVVFVLDTTGSMSGLIAAAQDKIWAIANTLVSVKPTPTIRFGLVGYRDKGDAYVTKRFELSEDLDAAYTELFDYEAGGGGDTPEAVNRALNEAVTGFEWSTEDSVHRVIYLVGDCPPHANEAGEVPAVESAALAASRGIVVNTIQCGSHAATTPIWQELAKLGNGQFAQIEQSGGRVVMETPFDAKIAELSAERDATRVWFGVASAVAAQEARLEEVAEAAKATPASVQARRGVYNSAEGGALNFYFAASDEDGASAGELVDAIVSGRFDDEEVQAEQLPAEWRELSDEERTAKAEEIAAKRAALAKQIKELGDERQKFLEAEMKKAGEDVPELDRVLFDSIREQIGDKGLKLDGGPKL